MKTHNYNIELMVPMQTDKEILFNESLSTIDNFCNSAITSFVSAPPFKVTTGDKYIISSGNNRNYICYSNHSSKGWQFLKPQNDMILFVRQMSAFYTYGNNNWQPISSATTSSSSATTSSSSAATSSLPLTVSSNLVTEGENFKGTGTKYEAPADSNFLYLYLNENCQVDLSKLRLRQVTIFLKQHFQKTNTIRWPANILWKNKIAHKMTDSPNSIDVIKFYRLVETSHYIGEIIGQDYKF